MSELKSLIEAKISQLQDQAKKQNSDLNSFSNAKAVAERNLAVIDGAIQAYQDTLKSLEATSVNAEESGLSG
jgi:CHASE3 domain sensor protein